MTSGSGSARVKSATPGSVRPQASPRLALLSPPAVAVEIPCLVPSRCPRSNSRRSPQSFPVSSAEVIRWEQASCKFVSSQRQNRGPTLFQKTLDPEFESQLERAIMNPPGSCGISDHIFSFAAPPDLNPL